MNPSVSYTPKGKAQMRGGIEGVAVWLKGFMDLLDEFDIDHPSEDQIRRELKGKRTCDTRMKQYFNAIGSTAGWSASRNDKVCRTCVCIPKDDVPGIFYSLLRGKINVWLLKLMMVVNTYN